MSETTRSADSVEIGVWLAREVEVDHNIDWNDINTSSEHVWGDQATSFPPLEVMENSRHNKKGQHFDRWWTSFWQLTGSCLSGPSSSGWRSKSSQASWFCAQATQLSLHCYRRWWPEKCQVWWRECSDSGVSHALQGRRSTGSDLSESARQWSWCTGVWAHFSAGTGGFRLGKSHWKGSTVYRLASFLEFTGQPLGILQKSSDRPHRGCKVCTGLAWLHHERPDREYDQEWPQQRELSGPCEGHPRWLECLLLIPCTEHLCACRAP